VKYYKNICSDNEYYRVYDDDTYEYYSIAEGSSSRTRIWSLPPLGTIDAPKIKWSQRWGRDYKCVKEITKAQLFAELL